MHAISIITMTVSPMTIPQYGHDIKSPSRVMRRESFVRLPTLVPAVGVHQTAVCHPPSLWQADGIKPSSRERGTARGESPSGEKSASGRSEPLELCSTENHSYHLQNEAAKYYVQPMPGRIYRSRSKIEERCDTPLASPLAGSCPLSFKDHLPICQEPLKWPHELEFVNEEDSWTKQSGPWTMQYPCGDLV
jgi:hypothetical protein